MKKVLTMVLVVILVVSVCSLGFAESKVKMYEDLLRQYTWVQTVDAAYANNNYDGTFIFKKTIHLPDSKCYLTGDEVGNVYIGYYSSEYSYTGMGKVTFSSDYQTMIIILDNTYSSGWYAYTRK